MHKHSYFLADNQQQQPIALQKYGWIYGAISSVLYLLLCFLLALVMQHIQLHFGEAIRFVASIVAAMAAAYFVLRRIYAAQQRLLTKREYRRLRWISVAITVAFQVLINAVVFYYILQAQSQLTTTQAVTVALATLLTVSISQIIAVMFAYYMALRIQSYKK